MVSNRRGQVKHKQKRKKQFFSKRSYEGNI
jgi:hypothetical protein